MKNQAECYDEIQKRELEKDFPKCPKCEVVTDQMGVVIDDSAGGYAVEFRCDNKDCRDPHDNPTIGPISELTRFWIKDSGLVELTTPGRGEFL